MTELCHMLRENGIAAVEACPLAQHSSFRIGGHAALGVFPKSREELLRALSLASDCGVEYSVVGKASNLLFPDGVYAGAVIFTDGCRRVDPDGACLIAEAGATLAALARQARNRSLSGLSFAAGIPGTVGGAVFMNAGAFGGCMQQVVAWSEYWDPVHRCCCILTGDEHAFGVRKSTYLQHPEWVILRVGLQLHAGDPKQIDAETEAYRIRRSATQPLEFPNAGSIFRHPAGAYAGQLIESCGLKGVAIGGAEVSQKHAGFIINRGNATEQDVLELIERIRSEVYKAYGIRLECELRRLNGKEI